VALGFRKSNKNESCQKRFYLPLNILGVRRKFYLFFKFEGKNSIIHKPEVKTTNQLSSIQKLGKIFSTNM
jgi:hypothetical protein